jgi:hypothetical protein
MINSNKNTGLTPVEEKADTSRGKHSLLHWETLLVTTSHNLEDITIKFLQNTKTLAVHMFETGK